MASDALSRQAARAFADAGLGGVRFEAVQIDGARRLVAVGTRAGPVRIDALLEQLRVANPYVAQAAFVEAVPDGAGGALVAVSIVLG